MNDQEHAGRSASDQALAERLHEALRAVPGVIVADVTNGAVTLSGVAPSPEITDHIAEIAGRVEGVVSVNAESVAAGIPEPEDDDEPEPFIPAFIIDA